MESTLSEMILAIITTNPDAVLAGGTAPVFRASSSEEQEALATTLSKILTGMIHDLENGIYLIVRH